MTEKPHKNQGRKGEYPMELLHIDVAGPFDEGLDGSRYWLIIVASQPFSCKARPMDSRGSKNDKDLERVTASEGSLDRIARGKICS
jgi:hypothetical protein